MAEIASAYVSLLPSAKGFGSKLNSEVGGSVRSSGTSLGRTFGKLFALSAGVIAAAGVGRFLKGSIDEAREAQKVGAQTNAVLKSTAGVAGLTADQVGKMATRLSGFTGIDDEAIQSGENLLLTFTNVRNEVGGKFVGVFDQATQAAVDMGVALGTDTKTAALQLGKALNDPAKGYSRLQRSGVSFTDTQIEQIKNFQKTGQVAKAQGIILGEVTKEFGGSAAAQATAGDKARVAFDNIKESVGTALLPALDSAERAFTNRVAPAIQNVLSGSSRLTPAFKLLRRVIGATLSFIGGLISRIDFRGIFAAAQAAVIAALPAFKRFGAQLKVSLANVLEALRPVISEMSDALKGLLPTVVRLASGFAGSLGPALVAVTGFLKEHKTLVGAVVTAVVAMVAAYKVYKLAVVAATAVQAVLNAVLSANPIGVIVLALVGLAAALVYAYKHSETFRNIVDGAFKGIQKVVSAVIGFVVPFVKKHWQLLVGIIGGPLAIIVVQVIKHFGTIKKVVGAAASFVIDSAKKYAEFVSAVIGFFKNLVTGVKEKITSVVNKVKEIPGKIVKGVGDLGRVLYNAGKAVIDGLIRGITAKFGALKDKLGQVGSFIKNHKGPPAKDRVMLVPAGQMIMDGLIAGIASREGALDTALGKVGDRIKKKTKEQVAKLRDSLSSARSDFASLVEPIASNFTQGLFDFDTAGAFTANLATVKGTLTALIGNFKKLIGEGLSPGFLYQLFQSGGPGLINSLAALDKKSAQDAGSLFGDVTSLSDQLGTLVAGSTDKGAALENQTQRLERKLDHLIKSGNDNARMLAESLTQPAKRARRRAVLAA
jgi:phage-related protein